MLPRILITLGVLMYAAVVPWLEINQTHVFNPEWVPHARLHEVWQLLTNSAIGLYCLWLAWVRGNIRLPALLGGLVMGGFLVAYAIRASYGGSMVLSDGSEKMVGDWNLGVASFGLAILLSLLAVWLDARRPAGVTQPASSAAA